MDFNKTLQLMTEAEVTWKKGTELSPEQQAEVKAKYVHRHTGNNKPEWAKQTWKDGKPYPQQHKDDKDWLANTTFAVTKKGELCKKTKYCQSNPTWPNNPELRKKDVKESLCEASEHFVSDALDKIISGVSKPTQKELDTLKRMGLIDDNGKPTKKAREEYSELFEDLNEAGMRLSDAAKGLIRKFMAGKASAEEKGYIKKWGFLDSKGKLKAGVAEKLDEATAQKLDADEIYDAYMNDSAAVKEAESKLVPKIKDNPKNDIGNLFYQSVSKFFRGKSLQGSNADLTKAANDIYSYYKKEVKLGNF